MILLHLYCAPYTKVEESFNIQAIHDIIVYGVPLKNIRERLGVEYDHFTFTGPVPRTFVGALTLAQLTHPWARFVSNIEDLQVIGEPDTLIEYAQTDVKQHVVYWVSTMVLL